MQHRQQQATASSSRPRPNIAQGNWKAFGPTSEFSDGDADYYATSNRLSQQYDWFAPRDQPEPEPEEQPQPEQDRNKPSFGLSQKQISALGLSGPRLNLPDPVGGNEEGKWGSLAQSLGHIYVDRDHTFMIRPFN